MDYYRVEESFQVLLERNVPLSSSQNQRIRQLCLAVLLAGNTYLSQLARWLPHTNQQDSRVQWIRRLLQAPYLTQEIVYQPLIKQALQNYKAKTLHLIMDRSPLHPPDTDLLSLNLYFRRRAIALAWEIIPHGSSNLAMQQRLVERVKPLLPAHTPTVFHGDNEFGGMPFLHYLRQQSWQLILGQSAKNYYRLSPTATWQLLGTLPVTATRAVYLQAIELTKKHTYGPLNLYAFYQPRFSKKRRKHDITYCATTLPITPTLRCTGRHRWGVECFYKDYKSAGWAIDRSKLTHPQRCLGLLTILGVAHLWTTCLGRWLCKTGQRKLVDSKSQRHLSLFRLGWDWLVHQYRTGLPCPALLTLYQ